MVINMKHGYVYENLLSDRMSKDAVASTTNMIAQLSEYGCKSITASAQLEVDYAMDYVSRMGLRPGQKMPNLKSKMEYVRHQAADFVVFAANAKTCYHQAMVRLNDGKAFWYFNPYNDTKLVNVTDLEVWEEVLTTEKAKAQRWYNNMEFEALNATLKYEMIAVLNTPTPWLGDSYRLNTLSKQFPTFDAFLDYCTGIIEQLESMPNTDWDIDLTVSPVMRAKADSAHGIINSGIDKGKRTFFHKEEDTNGYWYNYEVAPVDVLKKFLHLTFLQSINYKPLIRFETDGAEYGTRAYFEYNDDGEVEQGLTVTPLYEDPYFHEAE